MIDICSINVAFFGSGLDIREMNEKTSHRGNLGGKILQVRGAFLGHVRLAVQGLSREFDQPYIFEEEEKVVLYNGEIYNFKELDPEKKCDTLIIPFIPFIKWDGDFAVVVYYKKDGRFKVITDRFGKKQLFYKVRNGQIIGISSEIKALITKESTIDYYYLSTVGRNGYVFNQNSTFSNDIKRFMPGTEYIISNEGKILSENKIEWDSSKLVLSDFLANFKELMNLSIRRRMVSDIPLAILYSGGLDSSIVLQNCIKNKIIPDVFVVENSRDIEFAERYCGENGIKPIKINLETNDKIYNEAHFACESGVDLGSVIPKYTLFKEVKNHGFNVCMGGSGADEVFGGYDRMKEFDFQQNDIFNELIYYHLPRLDKLSMYNTIEYRTPYTADYIIDYGLSLPYEKRIDKIFLRETYFGSLPLYILERPKEALKIDAIKRDKEEERLKLINWVKVHFNDYKKGITEGQRV